MNIRVGISNRHVHLREDSYKKLFGDLPFEMLKELNQPGEFASNQKVSIKTDKDKIENVRIIGPFRKYNQVEISRTDSYKLGIRPPIRNSGELEGSETITLIGPSGEILLENSCILANRHIHLTEEDIKKYGFENIEKVKVHIDGEKGGTLENVYLKKNNAYAFELHLDTDDANAFNLKEGQIVEICK